ncbi:MAG: DUF86 domain-containing protein [Verrucomicrobiota bacterium]|nr:DUF86 domain-containing protein [Verrucomicrobiota bacterium]
MSKSIDNERIEKLIGSIRESLSILGELARLPEGEFIRDVHKQGSAKYSFIAGIEASIDIANHVISRKGFRCPEDYADTFKVLGESGILDPEFAVELGKMARFRNRLVHRYWDLDAKEIWGILQSRLGDFEKYVSRIGAYLSPELGN